MGKYPSHSLLAALLTVALTHASPVLAALPQFTLCAAAGTCGTVHAIGDDQLAEVAGRFTVAGEVVGMSLTMTSSWQTANGQRLEAAAGVSIALPGSSRAGASFHAHAGGSAPSGDESATAGTTRQVHQGQGLASVNGVAQVIQVAGDRNGAANQAEVRVSPDPLASMAGNGQRYASYSASNGARADVAIESNSVAMNLTMPNKGSARQHFNLAGSGNIHQGIQVAADGQRVVNALQLQLQVQQLGRTALTAQGVHHSLDMLRGR